MRSAGLRQRQCHIQCSGRQGPCLPRRRLSRVHVAPVCTVLRPDTQQTWRAAAAATAELSLVVEPPVRLETPVLLTKLVKAHAARVSSVLVLRDGPDAKLVVSSGLDKTMGTWQITLAPAGSADTCNGSVNEPCHQITCTRLPAPGGPVFSLVRAKPAAGSVFTPGADVLYCGNAAKEVVAWEVKGSSQEGDASFQTIATDYTGWVRAMALMGKWLFSCGCNYLVQHDTSYPIPKEVSKEELFKGDIQAIITHGDHVYVASADGVLRAWKVSKTGALTPVGEVPGAHASRISALAVHGNTLYSASFDGWIKAWNADTLALVAAVPAAHGGEKVHAMALGSDGLLYTGGDDKLIRSWEPVSPALDFLAALEPVAEASLQAPPASHGAAAAADASNSVPTLPAAGEPLTEHESGVRVLAAGNTECLVSGDSDGNLCVWALPLCPGASSGRRSSKGSNGKV